MPRRALERVAPRGDGVLRKTSSPAISRNRLVASFFGAQPLLMGFTLPLFLGISGRVVFSAVIVSSVIYAAD
jgi:hypothetical protein